MSLGWKTAKCLIKLELKLRSWASRRWFQGGIQRQAGGFDPEQESPYDEEAGFWRSALLRLQPAGPQRSPRIRVAHSFNGRTAASGAAYWGSNPWWAAKTSLHNGEFPVPVNLRTHRKTEAHLEGTDQLKHPVSSGHLRRLSLQDAREPGAAYARARWRWRSGSALAVR